MMRWIWIRNGTGLEKNVIFRTEVDIPESGGLTFDYSADDTCQWFADGHFVGSGNEEGMRS